MFFDAFLQRAVRSRPIWIRPSNIGPLPAAELGLAGAGRLTGGRLVYNGAGRDGRNGNPGQMNTLAQQPGLKARRTQYKW